MDARGGLTIWGGGRWIGGGGYKLTECVEDVDQDVYSTVFEYKHSQSVVDDSRHTYTRTHVHTYTRTHVQENTSDDKQENTTYNDKQ